MNQIELAQIKRKLFEMLVNAGKQEEDGYDSLIAQLHELSFRDCSLELYATQLVGIINDMCILDDLAFDLGQLHNYLQRLSSI